MRATCRWWHFGGCMADMQYDLLHAAARSRRVECFEHYSEEDSQEKGSQEESSQEESSQEKGSQEAIGKRKPAIRRMRVT